jgi:hypothetical protein
MPPGLLIGFVSENLKIQLYLKELISL